MKLENIIRSSWKFNFSVVLLVYLVAHLLMLLSNGVWWDDFVVWNVTPEKLYAYLGPADANEPFQYAYIHWITDMFPLNQQVYVFHLISFLIHGITLICCWFIIKELTSDLSFTTMCSLLIAVFGFDTTSMLIICSHYTVANCLFLMGLLMCLMERRTNKQYLLFLTGIAWLLSVLVWRSAALLMPFCLLVLACAHYKDSLKTIAGWKNVIKYLFVHYWPVIVILLIFFPCYILFMRPSGDHAGYYAPDVKQILTSPFTAFISAILAIFVAVGGAFKALYENSSLIAACIIILLIAISYVYVRYIIVSENDYKSYGSLSCIAFAYLAISMILPLWIYGYLEVLDISEYKSRLLSLGALPIAVMIVYFLSFLTGKMRNLFFSIIFVGFAMFTVYSYADYIYAWNKTELIADYLKQNPELEGKNILIIDHAFTANENESCLRFYAYEGMARMAYGQDTKTKMETVYWESYGSSFIPDYKLQCTSNFPINRAEKCDLVFSKWLFKRKYQRLKGQMLHIEHKKCD